MVTTKTQLFKDHLQEQAILVKTPAHSARLQILHFVSKTGTCISSDISDEFPLSRTTVNEHLKELKEAGLIKVRVTGTKYFVDYSETGKMKDFLSCFFNEFQFS